MGVGIQGEACEEALQRIVGRLDVHAVLLGNSGKGMAEIVESDPLDTSSLQHSHEHIVDTVCRDGAAVGIGKHISVIGLVHNKYYLNPRKNNVV